MEFKYYVIIGGIIVGLLILIFGLFTMKKMKNDEKKNDKVGDSNLEKDTSSVVQEDFVSNSSVNTVKEEDNTANILTDDIHLNNSSLDSEIVSKPSVETEKDFLQKNSEPVKTDNSSQNSELNIEPVKTDNSSQNSESIIEPIKTDIFPDKDVKQESDKEKVSKDSSDDKIENLF